MVAPCSRPLANEQIGHEWSVSFVVVVYQTDRISLSTTLSHTVEIYDTTSGNECNVSYVIMHTPDLRHGRQIDNSVSRT